MISESGLAYTVDEVSDLVGVPRPTLYRYLREYSIPHLRRSGKIFIPEESFDRIKEVRELHREGLGTESVRKRLQDESSLDTERIVARLDRISETLESLQGNLKAANTVSSAQTLQTILARQSLLISAVSNLSDMIEDLLHANGWRRQHNTFSEQLEEHHELINNTAEPVVRASTEPAEPLPTPIRRKRKKFGAMARRRRRGVLAILLALLTSIALIAFSTLSNQEGSGVSQEETSAPSQEAAPGDSQEVSTSDSDTTQPDSTIPHEEEIGPAVKGYEDPTQQQPSYQPPGAAPTAPPQGWPGPPLPPNGGGGPVASPPIPAR